MNFLFLIKIILYVKKMCALNEVVFHCMERCVTESTEFAGVCIMYGINHGIFSYCTVYFLQTNVFKFQNIETDNIRCLST